MCAKMNAAIFILAQILPAERLSLRQAQSARNGPEATTVFDANCLRHSWWFRTIALMMDSRFLAQAVMAGLPAS